MRLEAIAVAAGLALAALTGGAAFSVEEDFSVADPRGRGMYPYLTGAGSWLMLSLITRVWGVQGSPEGVRFSPQLPPEWFDAQGVSSVRCMIAGREALVRCHGPGKTVARVLLDGEEVSQPLSREAIRNAKTACIDIELEG